MFFPNTETKIEESEVKRSERSRGNIVSAVVVASPSHISLPLPSHGDSPLRRRRSGLRSDLRQDWIGAKPI
ncbi:hypothetical protein GUJ93_ZPchr0008g12484 [Zizania palustris]|uniref:Uncharacterized protein n=1 Tax=Zizania palustris TaxID=103762 RepID=A0A8J5RG40_ZIZPA|nr:hypothetical protein GUJ93_ZPchr0008g12484 [Zizania palustris]